MNPRSILIVDDNPISRKFARALLQSEGYAVLGAEDAQSALALAEREQPDVILQDLRLPDMDGFELLRRLRALPGGAERPIIALTGFLLDAGKSIGLEATFTDYLFKPVNSAQLLETVRLHMPAPYTAAPQAAQRHILIADDDPLQAKLLRIRLRELGFQATLAEDGQAALEAARAAPPDAIVSDVLMPRLDGFKLCMALRQDAALAHIPVVLTSNAYVEEDDRALARQAGANALVLRTPELTQVIEALEVALGSAAARPAAPAPEALAEDYTARVVRQLERQTQLNLRLSRRLAWQEAGFAALAGLADAIRGDIPLEAALQETLHRCLEASGSSSGIAYLFDDGRLVPRACLGYERRDEFEDFFGHLSELRQVIDSGEPLLVPSAQIDDARARDLLTCAGARSLLILPLLLADERLGALVIGLTNESVGEVGAFPRMLASQISQVVGLARAMTELRESRAALQAANADLERRVAERTAELTAANARLEHEIAERREAEAAAQAARAEAERASAAKSEFLSRMSHELRTPMNAILGFAQLMEMDANTSQRHQESLGYILKAGQHLLNLINEVLDIARIEAGRVSLSLEPVRLDDTIQSAVELVESLAGQRAVRLEVEACASPAYVMADRQRLTQVLLNLLSNAIKYNHDGGRVTIVCQALAGGRLRVRVTDNGAGIPSDRQARLFVPFDRLGAERTGVEGTGLGLVLSKHLIEAMGGQLGLSSIVGVGSVFWFELDQAAPQEETAAPGIAESISERERGADRVVLFIEDNLANVRLIERVLEQRPEVRLIPAMQGRLGLELARQHQPDLILLDLHLPDMMGDVVLHRLQADPLTRDIPVVMISADAMGRQVQRLLAAGAREYLAKPIDVRRFLEVLDTMIAKRESGKTVKRESGEAVKRENGKTVKR